MVNVGIYTQPNGGKYTSPMDPMGRLVISWLKSMRGEEIHFKPAQKHK